VTARTDLDRGTPRPEFYSVLKELRLRAAVLSQAIDEFERVARRRVPPLESHVASARINAEKPLLAARQGIAELTEDAVRNEVPELVSAPRVVIRIVPLAVTGEYRFESSRAADAMARMAPDITRYHTGSDDRQWWIFAPTKMKSGPNPETAWLSRLVYPGYIEHSATFGWPEGNDETVLVDGRTLEGQVVRAFRMLCNAIEFLGLDGDALATVTLEMLRGVELTMPNGGRRFRKEIILFPEIQLVTGKINAGCLKETFDRLWRAAGWENGSPSYQGGSWAGYTTPHLYGG